MINTIKKGDWFKFNGWTFKVYECSPDSTMVYMHQMICENGDYIEGELYQFSIAFINLYMIHFKLYWEEKTNDT